MCIRDSALANKVLETMNKRIPKYSYCFNQNREQCNESDSSLGSPKPAVSLYDDFEPSYQSRPNLHDVLPLPSLERQSDLPMSLPPNLAPHTSSHTDVTDDVLIYADPPTTLHDSSEFEAGRALESASELDMSIPSAIEHHDKLEDISQESCEEEVEPTNLEFNIDILSVEYEYFSCGFDITTSLDKSFSIEYESFSFDPLIP